jgi:Golgi apparatus protein 1
VYKCLAAGADDLDAGCRKELGRAIHMAFFIWIPGGILTTQCDVDIAEVCLKARPNMLHQPGAVGTCLADTVSLGCFGGGCLRAVWEGRKGCCLVCVFSIQLPTPNR